LAPETFHSVVVVLTKTQLRRSRPVRRYYRQLRAAYAGSGLPIFAFLRFTVTHNGVFNAAGSLDASFDRLLADTGTVHAFRPDTA